MGIYMKSDPKLLTAANSIREALTADVDRIQSQPGLSNDATQCLVARAYLAAKAQMDALNVNTTAATDARMRVLTGQVWGVDDIPGDKVSASISYRDATDRAQALTSPHDAMILLTTAERSGGMSCSPARSPARPTPWLGTTSPGRTSRPAQPRPSKTPSCTASPPA